MKIDIYTLLGLVKDGKAPKKINFCGNIYEWEDDWYLTKEKNYKVCLGGKKEDHNILINAFNEDVEIIEEPKKIEKINEILMINDLIPPYGENEYKAWKNIIIQQNKINELIDEINNLKEK